MTIFQSLLCTGKMLQLLFCCWQ